MSPHSRRHPARRRHLVTLLGAAVAGAVLAAVVLAISANRGDDSNAPGAASGEPGVAHVHGLGVNPADGSLVVATHYGSFRFPADGGDAERIGESYQDTMGFTVAGPDHFLGSGHPDAQAIQEGQPTRLGLIESSDAGATWTIVSLGGEVDFHALAYAHDQVYGWDSGTGRFMVSRDKRQWERLATVDLFSFGVDPEYPDHIVGAGPEGLVESRDGGRTWRGLDGPPLVTVSWDTDAGLWGAEAAGPVWHLSEADWEHAGDLPGQPQVFLATGDALYAAVQEADNRTAIHQSTDEGRTWDLRYREPAQ